jgi:hypothetical protein
MQTQNPTSAHSLSACSLGILRVSIADMISLNVRTRGSRTPELPKCLYQRFPIKAAALLATFPCGPFAVSIPGERRSVRGYPIFKAPVEGADGFVIIYRRAPDGRYEAAGVQYQGSVLEVGEFVRVARQWVSRHEGSLKAKSGCYAYFAPSREEWGCIQRDSGYTAWDSSAMPAEITPELRMSLQMPESSGIFARIPVFVGENQSADHTLAVFAQVEMTMDADPGPQSAWIGFEEYRRTRTLRAALPDSIMPDFQEWLRHLTEESGFEYWIFQSGMLLGDCAEWWGDGCQRRTEHEGIDFASGFRTGTGCIPIEGGIPIRSISDGAVVAILDDFIAKTVVLRHSVLVRSNGDVFYTFISHIQPVVAKTECVVRGHVVGRVGKSTNASAPMHLHLTGAWIPSAIAPNEITLDHIHPAFAPVSLADFLPLMRNSPLCRFEKSGRL